MPLQTEVLLQRNACARGAFKYGRSCADILLHDFRPRTRISHERVQQVDANSQFHHSFWWSRRISCQRVARAQTKSQFHLFLTALSATASTQNHPYAKNRKFTSVLTIETHLVQEGLRKTIKTQKSQFRCRNLQNLWSCRCLQEADLHLHF